MMATMGVTRGFGDHDIKVHGTELYVKPFMSPRPEVGIFTAMCKFTFPVYISFTFYNLYSPSKYCILPFFCYIL